MKNYNPDQKADQLRRLSDEAGRIASTLAQLSVHSPRHPFVTGEDAPEISPKAVASVIRARKMRHHFLDAGLFADPAWDMMLELLHAELMNRRITVSSLCVLAEVPATTALRWINNLVKARVFMRRDDPLDGRRAFIELHSDTSSALRRFFAEADGSVVI